MSKQTQSNTAPGIWKSSLLEFRQIQVIATCGILAALGIILKHVATIDIGQFVRIGLSGIPDRIVATLFGPSVGGIFGAVLDILRYLVKPNGSFFPGFTISAAITAIIFGLVLYQKKAVQLSLGEAWLLC